jgi:hypothetical protein
MLDYVGKDLANNNPRCVIAMKKSNCEPWTIILQEKIRGKDGY